MLPLPLQTLQLGVGIELRSSEDTLLLEIRYILEGVSSPSVSKELKFRLWVGYFGGGV